MFSFASPFLLWGSLAVSSPIIIHLLSKRRYKIVNWAAMEFLLEADKRNRKRIQLENLILLILRCLAILLVVFLIARPSTPPKGMLARVIKTSTVERVVLVDDSPSMRATEDGKSSLAVAVANLKEFVKQLSESSSSDTFTLMLTSKPDQPVLPSKSLRGSDLQDILRTLDNLEPSDLSGSLDQALLGVQTYMEHRPSPVNPNWAFYLVTDFRLGDWAAASDAGEKEKSATVPAAVEALKKLAGKAAGSAVVDFGGKNTRNLGLGNVRVIDKAIIKNVRTKFEVDVFNSGDADVDDVALRVRIRDAAPKNVKIDKLEAGKSTPVGFELPFDEAGSYRVTLELDAAGKEASDCLAVDNVLYFSAHVGSGAEVLLVDGDPGARPDLSECYFLSIALAPAGAVSSGYLPHIVSDHEFEDLSLSKYKLVYLCNVYLLSDARVESLEKWVSEGGGLVIFLGDRMEEKLYNQKLFKGGKGLMPLELTEQRGDPKDWQGKWIVAEDAADPMLSVFNGAASANNNVQVYQWWGTKADKESVAASGSKVLARLTDLDASPLLVHKAFNKGQVLLVTTSSDVSWTNWPGDLTYPLTVLEMANRMSKRSTVEGSITVGNPIRYDLDSSEYELDATVIPPSGKSIPVTAARTEQNHFQVQFPEGSAEDMKKQAQETSKAGFYDVKLTSRKSRAIDSVDFAANIDGRESDLRRAKVEQVQAQLGEMREKVVFQSGRLATTAVIVGGGFPLWRWVVLPALLLILCVEQLLAWHFGRRR